LNDRRYDKRDLRHNWQNYSQHDIVIIMCVIVTTKNSLDCLRFNSCALKCSQLLTYLLTCTYHESHSDLLSSEAGDRNGCLKKSSATKQKIPCQSLTTVDRLHCQPLTADSYNRWQTTLSTVNSWQLQLLTDYTINRQQLICINTLRCLKCHSHVDINDTVMQLKFSALLDWLKHFCWFQSLHFTK